MALLGRPPITSARDPRFRAAVGLREARERRQQGRILIDGLREISRAVDAGVGVVEAWVDHELLGDPAISGILQRVDRSGSAVVAADARLIERLSYGERVTGLVLVVDAPVHGLERLALPADPLVGVLDGVEKPGNLGAVLRTADAAGLSALIVADAKTDLFNPNVIRASLGTVFTVPSAVASAADSREWLRAHGLRPVTARVDAALEHTEADLTGPVAIVLGGEAEGLGEAWSGPDVTAVRVPMLGVADSLNVSVTAAIILYEALRQRRMRRRP